MISKMHLKTILVIPFVFLFLFGCNEENELVVNTDHLDFLYEEISVDSIDMAIVHIYSNYPEYNYIGDDDEGIACVDDAARAAVFYLFDWQLNKQMESINKNKQLIEFVLYMQAENGYFYNFIWEDYSINKDFRTSIAEANWWSWRALWVLSESYNYYRQNDSLFAARIWNSIERLIKSVKEEIPTEYNYEKFAGIDIPAWLPGKYASDQSALLLMGLTGYYKLSEDQSILNYMKKLSEGIMSMQVNDETFEYNGAFISWQNLWHAWGNLQSYALLNAHQVLNDSELIASALTELDNYYPALISENYLNSFTIEIVDSNSRLHQKEKYSQIAYNIRPMVFALLKAHQITGNEEYAKNAALAAKWLTGRNVLNTKLYDEETGRVFDGINSEVELNRNSGAESTIEGLLTLIKIKENETALKYFLSADD